MPKLGRLPLQKLTPRQIKMMQAEIAKASGAYTANRAKSLLGNILGDAVSEGYLTYNPARLVKGVKHQSKRIQIWTAEEIEKALTVAAETSRLYARFYVALTTSLRHGELLGLQWSRVRFYDSPEDAEADAGEITVDQAVVVVNNRAQLGRPKSPSAYRAIGIDVGTKLVLEIWRERLAQEVAVVKSYVPNDLVFHSYRGTIINQSNTIRELDAVINGANPQIRKHLKAQAQELRGKGMSEKEAMAQAIEELEAKPDLRAKLEEVKRITVHDLRHTHASMLIAAGMDPVAVSKRLGHESPEFTMRKYAHFFEKQRRLAAPSLAKLTGLSLQAGGGKGGGKKRERDPSEKKKPLP